MNRIFHLSPSQFENLELKRFPSYSIVLRNRNRNLKLRAIPPLSSILLQPPSLQTFIANKLLAYNYNYKPQNRYSRTLFTKHRVTLSTGSYKTFQKVYFRGSVDIFMIYRYHRRCSHFVEIWFAEWVAERFASDIPAEEDPALLQIFSLAEHYLIAFYWLNAWPSSASAEFLRNLSEIIRFHRIESENSLRELVKFRFETLDLFLAELSNWESPIESLQWYSPCFDFNAFRTPNWKSHWKTWNRLLSWDFQLKVANSENSRRCSDVGNRRRQFS